MEVEQKAGKASSVTMDYTHYSSTIDKNESAIFINDPNENTA